MADTQSILDQMVASSPFLSGGTSGIPTRNPTGPTGASLFPATLSAPVPSSAASNSLSGGDLGGSLPAIQPNSGSDSGSSNPPSPDTFVARLTAQMGQQYAVPTPGPGSPINLQLPTYERQYTQKWNGIDTTGIAPENVAAVQKYDSERMLKGQPPLNRDETLMALQSAQARKVAVTQQRDPSDFFGNILADATQIGKSIIHIPELVASEITHLPELPGDLANAHSISDVLSAPGIRMIPGAYDVKNLLAGPSGWEEAARHPLMSFLDALPAASKAAELAPVTQAAEAERATALTAAEADAQAGKPYVSPKEINPLRTVLTRTLDEEGNVVPNKLGTVTQNLMANTRPGQLISRTFGADNRAVSTAYEHLNAALLNATFGESKFIPASLADHPLLPVARSMASLYMGRALTDYGLHPEEIPALTDIATGAAAQTAPLNDGQLGYVQEIKDASHMIASYKASPEGGETMVNINGNWYNAEQGNKILGVAQKFNDTADRFIANSLGADKGVQLDSAGNIVPQYTEAGRLVRTGSSIRELAEAPGADPRLQDLYTNVENRDFIAARSKLIDMMRPKTNLGNSSVVGEAAGPAANVGLSTISNMRGSLDRLAELQAKMEGIQKALPPASFGDLIDRLAGERIGQLATQQGVYSPVEIAQAVAERRYEDIVPHDDVVNIQNDVARSWQTLQANGQDPLYISHVTPDQAMLLQHPKILPQDAGNTLSSDKIRSMDHTPYVHDGSLAMTHQAMDVMANQGREYFAEFIRDHLSTPFSQVKDALLPSAREQALGQPIPGLIEVNSFLKSDIGKRWTVFNPDSYVGFESPKLAASGVPGETYLIPKTLAKTLDQLRVPPTANLGDVPMTVFRTSVLNLSPRWLAYSTIGHALLLTLRTDPTVFRYLSQARDMIENGNLPEELKLSMGATQRARGEMDLMGGRTIAKWGQQVRDAMPGMAPVLDTFNKVSGFSGRVTQMFSEAYRAMAYLYGQDKALNAGLSPLEAEARGIALGRSVMANWDNMTPVERSIVKQIFPFYGFTSHMMRYAVTYPMDHPFRMAVMGALARNEEQQNNGLPDTNENLLWLGGQDAQGNRKGITIAGMNPFADVASHFTLAGFVAGANPIVSAALDTLGYSQTSRGPELYPQLQYNAETGQMESQTKNPLLNIATSEIPQLGGVLSLAGINNGATSTNPASANRILRSALGLPTGIQTVNIPEQYAKATITARTAAGKALNSALKTGDDSYARQFPQLNAYIDQVRALQGQNPAQFSQYSTPVPTASTPGRITTALNVLTG